MPISAATFEIVRRCRI